jgi:SsrA-binding protein
VARPGGKGGGQGSGAKGGKGKVRGAGTGSGDGGAERKPKGSGFASKGNDKGAAGKGTPGKGGDKGSAGKGAADKGASRKGGAGNAPTVTNRTARFKYHIEESLEAGIQLLGSEVKAIRAGKANLTDSYVRMKDTEAFLVGCHIGAYEGAGQFNHEPMRPRKLLMHRRELDKFMGRVREKGLTAVVTKLYFKDGRVKAELALARGKKAHDKRATIRERVVRKEMERAMKQRMR